MSAAPKSAPILVTGALGNVGHHVVTQLLDSGLPVRAADIAPDLIGERFGDRVQARRLDFTDPATWDCFAGTDTLFLMRPPQLSNISRDMIPALEAARSAGVRHVVLLSLQGAEHNKVVPHAKIEAWLRTSGQTWTFVRPSFFLENLSTTHRRDIAERDEIFVPAGSGRTSFVAASDVASVAVAALVDPAAHRNAAWTPTGPAALTYDEVAAILTDVLGRPITYRHPGATRYAWHARRTLHMPLPMVAVTTAIYTVARIGKAAQVTDDVQTVTGRPAIDVPQWAHSNAQVWS